jgi:hypothetical protein
VCLHVCVCVCAWLCVCVCVVVCVFVCRNRVSQNQRSRIQPNRGLRATLSFRDRPVSTFRQILMTCG